jgi:hypothetical protein
MRLFFNIILVICIVILVTYQSFYLYKYNKILSRITFLLADEKIKEDRNLILEYNYNLSRLNYILCIYFSGIVKKILLKKNKFEYIE